MVKRKNENCILYFQITLPCKRHIVVLVERIIKEAISGRILKQYKNVIAQ